MPNEYDFFDGQYPRPLKNVISDGGNFTDAFSSGTPENAVPDESNFYIVCCTPAEMLKIQSSLEVGAPIAYPDSYSDVQQIVQQAYEFPNSFEGADCVDLCALIAQCISESTEVQDAINNYVSGTQIVGVGTTDGTYETIGDMPVFGNTGCDEDNVYALALQLTDFVNTLITDFFEELEAASNLAEQVSIALSGIPVIGLLPIDEIIDFVQNGFAVVAEGYAAAYDEPLRREISCAIFCQILDDGCFTTFGNLSNLFLDAFLLDFTTLDLQDVIDWFTQGIFSGDEFVYAMFACVFALMGLGSEVNGVTAHFIDLAMQAMSNDSDGDWDTYCEDCGDHPWCVILDFDNPDGSVDSFCGTASGQELLTDNVLCDGAYWARLFTSLTPFTLTYFEIHSVFVGSNANARFATAVVNDGTGIDGYATAVPTGGSPTWTYDNPSGVTCDEIQMYARNGTTGTPPTTNTAKISYVEIHGVGTNPFENATECP